MKKTATSKKIKLQLGREVVRILQTHELRQIEGGAIPPTRDSQDICCA